MIARKNAYSSPSVEQACSSMIQIENAADALNTVLLAMIPTLKFVQHALQDTLYWITQGARRAYPIAMYATISPHAPPAKQGIPCTSQKPSVFQHQTLQPDTTPLQAPLKIVLPIVTYV